MKSIYTYYDYRRYLSDFYREKKALNSNFSYRYMSGKLDIDHALIVKILRGERHVSSKKVDTFAVLLGLSERQRAYFRLLVAFGKAKSHEDRKLFFEKLLVFSDLAVKKIDAGQYEFYQRWYYTAVRELINITRFSDDYQWLARSVHPAITPSQAKRAVKLLERLGMIHRDGEGYYQLTDGFITTGEQWHSIAIRVFQKEACTLAAGALDSIPPEERDISTVTLSLNEEGLNRLRDSLATLRREIIEVAASCDSVDRVYQINLQLFPVSVKISGEKEPK